LHFAPATDYKLWTLEPIEEGLDGLFVVAEATHVIRL